MGCQMTSPKGFGGLVLLQFSKRCFFRYGVTPHPGKNDIYRGKWLRKAKFEKLPYFTGSDIIVDLDFEPAKQVEPCSVLKYSWYLIPEREASK